MFNKISKSQNYPRWPYVLVGVCFVLYCLAFAWLSVARHDTYYSTGLDLGIYDQAIWNSAHGRLFASSVETDNLLGDHTDFALLLYVPLFWIWSDVRLLLVAQTVVLASGVLPVALLAKRRLGEDWLAALMGGLYLLYPALGFINRFDFHPEVIILPAFLWALLFIDQRRWLPTVFCLLLAMLSKEYIGLEIAGYGFYIWLVARENVVMRRIALACLVVGPLWTALMLGWVIPEFRHGLTANFTERYLWFLGLNSPDFPKTVFLIFTKVLFPFELLLPFLFLPILAPKRLIPLIIPWGIAFASSAPAQSSIFFHYMAEFIPVLFAAAVYGLERQIGRFEAKLEFRQFESKKRLLVFSLLVVSVAYWVVRDPFTVDVPPIYYAVSGPHLRTNAESLTEALQLIPNEGCVIASNHLVPHLSHRESIYILRSLGYSHQWPTTCDYVIADKRETLWGSDKSAFENLMKNGHYQVVFDQDDVVVAKLLCSENCVGNAHSAYLSSIFPIYRRR